MDSSVMMDRRELLLKLLMDPAAARATEHSLNGFDWDADADLVDLTRAQLSSALEGYLAGKIDPETLEYWANAIECRDDIGREEPFPELLNDVIHVLANSATEGVITQAEAASWLTRMGV